MKQFDSKDQLVHYGILGMKWGVRRYQNKDGSLTSAGKKRYDSSEYGQAKRQYEGAKLKRQDQQRKVETSYRKAAFSIGQKRKENTQKYYDEHSKLQTLKEAERKAKETYKFHKGSILDVMGLALNDQEFIQRADIGREYTNSKK